MLSRRVTREIGAQCAHQARDGALQAHVDNASYSVRVITLPPDFGALTSSALADTLLERSEDESDAGAGLARLLLAVCRRFGISYVRVDAQAAAGAELLAYGSGNSGDAASASGVAHLAAVVCLVEVLDGGAGRFRVVYLEQCETRSLHDLSLFAHHNFSVHSPCFGLLVAQLVEMFREFAARAVFPVFSPHRLRADANLWLRAAFEDAFHPLAFAGDGAPPGRAADADSACLWTLTQRWCQWELSNLDYLLKLNEFAGRSRDEMTRPAVVPWVVDFSAEAGGLRPLDRTKYRLSKGDAQLNQQFRGGHAPAYHVPELLSDIGWLVYRARVTPRPVLCRHVRSTWVPEEYPASMARLYAWTPDECIPHFYDDPAVFRSTHPDMADLALPTWASSPAEFVRWHREVLESDAVSERLHKWIDLAFGYLLSGEDAVEALNVHLSFVDPPADGPRVHGAVKLFTRPHPRRLPRGTATPAAPSAEERDEWVAEAAQGAEASAACGARPHAGAKSGSAALVDESVALMCTLRGVYDAHGDANAAKCERALLSVGVTVMELALAEYCRDLASHATFANRLRRAQTLLHDKSHMLPRNLRLALNLLLRVDCFSKIRPTLPITGPCDVAAALRTFFATSANAIAALLLLTRYQHVELQLRIATTAENDYNAQQLARERVHVLAQCFALEELRDLWLNLFVDTVDGGAHGSTAVCYRLLGRAVELAAGERRVAARLVAVIRRLLDAPNKHTVKLLDRRFVLQLCVRFGSDVFFGSFLPGILETLLYTADGQAAGAPDEDTVRETAKETTLWLSKRYGPFVTATQIASRLLSLLSVCYSSEWSQQPDMNQMSLEARFNGDTHCERVVGCLVEISAIYGTAFIALQYLPYCADVVAQAARRLSTASGAGAALESSAIAAVVALSALCDALSDRQLMDHLQDTVVDGVLFPAVRLFSSAGATFSSARVRRIFAVKTIGTLHLLALRVGAENVRRHLAGAVQRVFCTFNLVYDAEPDSPATPPESAKLAENAPKQLAETFTPDFARLLVAVFSAICGRQFLVDALPNASLVFAVAAAAADDSTEMAAPSLRTAPFPSSAKVARMSSRSSFTPPVGAPSSSPRRGASLELSSSASILNGNRLAAFALGDEVEDAAAPLQAPMRASTSSEPSPGSVPAVSSYGDMTWAASSASNFNPDANFPALNQKMGAEGGTARLTGILVDHLRAVLSRTSDALAFNHIALATFRGHTDVVRRLRALDNENSFVSASADRTLRLWSVRGTGEPDAAITPRWTYACHGKPVQDVVLMPSGGRIASCDAGSVHIWDPFRGTTLHRLEVNGMVGLDCLGGEMLGIATNEDNIVRTFDGRSGSWCHEMCAWSTNSPQVHARAIAVSPDGARKLAVALSNSSTVILDVRTGKILASFASVQSRVTQLEWLTGEMLASAHADHPAEIWTLTGDAAQLVDVSMTRRLAEAAAALAAVFPPTPARFAGAGRPILTRNTSANVFAASTASAHLQRSSSGKIPKPGGSAAAPTAGDETAAASPDDHGAPIQFITLAQSSSAGSRLCLYSDARRGIFADVRLRSDLAPGGVTALEYLRMNNMLLLGCAGGVIRLAS